MKAKSEPRARTVLVVALEPSAEQAACPVVEILARRGRRVIAAGTERMRRAGAELVVPVRDLAAVGPGEAGRRIFGWGRTWLGLRAAAREHAPCAALLVDAPDFNMPLARVLGAGGVAVIQYVAPQFWAWRARRADLLRRRCQAVACVLPFEEEMLRARGVEARYVGHPLLDEPPARAEAADRAMELPPGRKVVAFLPGSRTGEVERLAPAMLRAASLLEGKGITCVFAPHPDVSTRALGPSAVMAPPELRRADLLARCDAAVVASGTATLEAALASTPFLTVYKIDRLSWQIARRLVRIPYVSLPSWIAGEPVAPELLQDEVTPEAIVAHVENLLRPKHARSLGRLFEEVRERLGPAGAAGRVADMVEAVIS